jgi:hypothetical protein
MVMNSSREDGAFQLIVYYLPTDKGEHELLLDAQNRQGAEDLPDRSIVLSLIQGLLSGVDTFQALLSSFLKRERIRLAIHNRIPLSII